MKIRDRTSKLAPAKVAGALSTTSEVPEVAPFGRSMILEDSIKLDYFPRGLS